MIARVAAAIDRALWHAYALMALALGYVAVDDILAFHQASFTIAKMQAAAIMALLPKL